MRIPRAVVMLGLAAFVVASGVQAQDAKKGASPAVANQESKPPKLRPSTYGTTATSYYRISAAEFSAMQVPGVDNWNDVYYTTPGNLYRRYGQVANAFFIATPHLPSGAKLTYLEFDDCGGAVNTVHLNLYNCSFTGDCGVAAVQTIDATLGCGADSADISGLNLVVDNFSNQFLLRASTDLTDGSVSFAGVIIGYQLQVSPAPGSATFPDVPTTDFGFQYVEALVASGITGGCGGGNYCPDSPVTRRQMAIFISKALGLQWP